MKEFDLKRAIDAYTKAWAEAKKHGDEAAKALTMADFVSSERAKKLFAQSAERSLVASENYRKAADICLKVVEEMDRKRSRVGRSA
ncbi:hypothetical protein SAMN02745126_00212 [Enhydrobacter aerosaccus]|jgi:hypothetical protein|uniref:Uncharacterized protein n=1 Tax=Enhydrobacter aerosaccus TaxID=225324 RepID=A0A1T4JN71_9HYPH|nr:hypothetical protein [Enhydrobacter aerosaccus]SJZ31537.1 hypothetical protein SAMN02745126_00212 [Enhydrobacter aerosaccus]